MGMPNEMSDTEIKISFTHTLNIQVVLSKDCGAVVNGETTAVEDTTDHVLSDGETHDVASELNTSVFDVNTGGAFEDLNNSLLALNFKHFATTHGTVGQS